jgi:hypothetical protein
VDFDVHDGLPSDAMPLVGMPDHRRKAARARERALRPLFAVQFLAVLNLSLSSSMEAVAALEPTEGTNRHVVAVRQHDVAQTFLSDDAPITCRPVVV